MPAHTFSNTRTSNIDPMREGLPPGRRALLRTAVAGTAAAGSVLALGSAFPAQPALASVDATIDAHARRTRDLLAAEPDLARAVAAGKLAVAAARYDLRDQRVRILGWPQLPTPRRPPGSYGRGAPCRIDR